MIFGAAHSSIAKNACLWCCAFCIQVILISCGELQAGYRTVLLLVPKTTVFAGDTITSQLLAEKHFRARGAQDAVYATNASSIIGKVAKRTLRAGSPIPLHALRPAFVFGEGQFVTMEYVRGPLVISMRGVALSPGLVGEVVTVRNTDSGLTVAGRVRPDGVVEVKP